jgi:hypothetical protein
MKIHPYPLSKEDFWAVFGVFGVSAEYRGDSEALPVGKKHQFIGLFTVFDDFRVGEAVIFCCETNVSQAKLPGGSARGGWRHGDHPCRSKGKDFDRVLDGIVRPRRLP